MIRFFTSAGQSIGVSASASVLPMNIQDWSPLGWTGWISFQSKGLSRVFSSTTVQKHQFFGAQLFFIVQLSHPYMTTGKTIALSRWTFVGKVMSLLYKEQAPFNFMAAITICSDFGAPQNKVCHVSPSICHEVMGLDAMTFVFWMLSFRPTFSLSSFTFIKRLFSSSLLSAIRVVSSAYLRLLIFLWAILILQLVLPPAWHFARCNLHTS